MENISERERGELVETPVHSDIVYDGKIIRVHKDLALLPDGKKTVREVVRHPGAVAVVAALDGQFIFVRQYRYALAEITLEIPAGKLERGEEPLPCARRELREETGYDAELDFWGMFYSSPGFSDEKIYIYGARNLVWAPLTADDDEFLRVVRLGREEAFARLENGEFIDAKTVLGLLLYRKHQDFSLRTE
jgi:ADP-ribose pyrophosphatase